MEQLIAYILLVIAQILSSDGQSNVSRQVCTLDIPIEINQVTTCDDKQLKQEPNATGREDGWGGKQSNPIGREN